MDELDHQLKKLAAMAQQYPPGSLQRKKVMQRLLMLVERSGKLSYTGKGKYPDLYAEALQEMRLYILRNIDAYDPTRAKFMTWTNFKLDREVKGRIKDFTDTQKEGREISLSRPLGLDYQGSKRTQEDVLSNQDYVFLSDQIRQILEDDPEGLFKAKHMRGRPDINFQRVALYLMDNERLRKLAENLGINEQTMYSFFRRSRKEMRPHIDRYLKDN